MIPARYANLDVARSRFGRDAVDAYLAASARMDPLADETVKALEAVPLEARERLVAQALERGPEVSGAPEALRAYAASAWAVPPWVDFEHLERGGALVVRTGVFSAAALLCYSLPLGYLSPGGNKPLAMNGGLVANVVPRLVETAKFLVETCKSLRPGSPGFVRTLKVRLLHARVRRRILASGKWDHAQWGAPINQADMLGTNLMFSIAGLDGLRELGFRPSADEVAAFFSLWRYSGHLVGVEPELLTDTEAGARRVQALVLAVEAAPDDDSRTLTRALLASPLGAGASGRRVQSVITGLTRAFLGEAHADALQVPRDAWRHAVTAIRPVVHVLERARQLPFGEGVARAAGLRAWEALLTAGPGKLADEFAVGRQLRYVAQAVLSRATGSQI